jgi:hypothetical protein
VLPLSSQKHSGPPYYILPVICRRAPYNTPGLSTGTWRYEEPAFTSYNPNRSVLDTKGFVLIRRRISAVYFFNHNPKFAQFRQNLRYLDSLFGCQLGYHKTRRHLQWPKTAAAAETRNAEPKGGCYKRTPLMEIPLPPFEVHNLPYTLDDAAHVHGGVSPLCWRFDNRTKDYNNPWCRSFGQAPSMGKRTQSRTLGHEPTTSGALLVPHANPHLFSYRSASMVLYSWC